MSVGFVDIKENNYLKERFKIEEED